MHYNYHRIVLQGTENVLVQHQLQLIVFGDKTADLGDVGRMIVLQHIAAAAINCMERIEHNTEHQKGHHKKKGLS